MPTWTTETYSEPYVAGDSFYTGWTTDTFADYLKAVELEDEAIFQKDYGFSTIGLDNDDIIRTVLSTYPEYGDPKQEDYITDLDSWRTREQVRGIRATGDYDHLNYSKNQFVNMFKQLQAGVPNFIGSLIDPKTAMGKFYYGAAATAIQMAQM